MTHRCLGLLDGVVQSYVWGSATDLASLAGRPPSGVPEAEQWFGAHPRAPSTFRDDGRPLDAHVAADPAAELGAAVALADGQLPFLVKLLAAARPLSLQVHPDDDAARAGFDAEQRRGIVFDDPARRFVDPWPKPEMLRAVGDFEALIGLVAAEDARVRLTSTAAAEARPLWRAAKQLEGGESAWPAVLAELLATPAEQARDAIDALVSAPPPADIADAHWSWVRALASTYPDDPAVLVALLLSYVRLASGDTVALPAGTVHAYLSGLAVEVMAPSDNVLRGGLTNKAVDVGGFVGLVDAASRPEVRRVDLGGAAPSSASSAAELVTGSPFFGWQVHRGTVAVTMAVQTVEIGLCTAGAFTVDGDGQRLELAPGQAYYRCASTPPATITGQGTLDRVTPGRVPRGRPSRPERRRHRR